MYCAKCGSPLPDANRFCNSCGALVKAPPPAPGAAPVAARPAPAYQAAPAFQAAPASFAAQPQPARVAAVPQPAPVAAVPQPAAGGAIPPDMHWALVWVLAGVTMGIFGLIWAFKQVNFVKKIDPASKAKTLFKLSLLAVVLEIVLGVVSVLVTVAMKSPAILAIVVPVSMLVYLAAVVAGLIAIFSMRSSLLRYYNAVENIGLKLSGVMTFFFNMLYFQYHFSRIAEWKRTGQLR